MEQKEGTPKLTHILAHVLAFVAVLIGLMWVYGAKENEHDSPSTQPLDTPTIDKISEARASAVAYAGAVHLASAGVNVRGIELVSSHTNEGDTYRIEYKRDTQRIVLFAERQCDRLDMEQLQRPACWIWR